MNAVASIATPLRRLVLALLVAALLPACSTIRIVYNNADEVVLWVTDDYLDLNREQEEGLRLLLARFHAWHRATQLPEYTRLLDAAERRLASGIAAADVAWATEAVHERYRVLVERAYADAARVLATLSDEQVAHLRRQLDEANRKWAREQGLDAGVGEQRRLRARRLLERIEHWTGSLDRSQSARIAGLVDALPVMGEQNRRFRLRRQHDFLVLLDARHDVDALAQRLRAWLLDFERLHAPEYGGKYADFVQARERLYVEGYRLLDAEQRKHVSERLRRYSRAFRELAEELPHPTSLAAVRP